MSFGGLVVHFKADDRTGFDKTISSLWRGPQVFITSRSQGRKFFYWEKKKVLPSASEVALSLLSSAPAQWSLSFILVSREMQECKSRAREITQWVKTRGPELRSPAHR